MNTYDLDDRYLVAESHNWENCHVCILNKKTKETLSINCDEVDHHGYSKLAITIASSIYSNVEFKFTMLREDTIKNIGFNVKVFDHIPVVFLNICHANYIEKIIFNEELTSDNGVSFLELLYNFVEYIKPDMELKDSNFDNIISY